jgi:hypothetical protein
MTRYSDLSTHLQQRIKGIKLSFSPGAYTRVIEHLLDNNPDYTENDVVTFLEQFVT